ncbi:carbamoyl-phosphate synthase (glutamine-hydrolyzing) large subunit [Sulfuracidifex metallicus]|uniref:Carbamoyl phosphate synthase large chain n=1 Tax=Sulfuracidifex metallicus DSM 6482 = JCM 9184 TaxID=523847 RepID=A0A6A9QGH7_SULME|nr:carbamoyl-phosphate synthase (glutamine-hydrolyzing) large subunit [Sulfuracidifex metallicus]MUN28186.1 carbamoyl-phosphate synthase (glutamine-hydrolyzing) large subunit [Sulfuracidifex metallicus DSM 6482 = JCM 9184]WOE51279.1 carbamoyl-phosphate synthase (glutamine-hydrolyzing) large subunit [Sulfuracidifex metallicus DSM 6482 = JCM 9184]
MVETPKKVMVIGSGPIKIAEAAEFDYSASQALKAFREEGISQVLVNSNVATVQTSKQFADKIYMVPVTWWSVAKVIEKERPDAIAIGFGGQTALNVGIDLFKKGILQQYGIKVLGTPIQGIERALSREKFRETMIERNLPVPPSMSATSVDEALKKAKVLGYPVMVRVSFNLGGRGSTVAWNENELRENIIRALSQSYIGEVLIEKYLHFWKELEYEVVRDSKGNAAVVACIENLDPMGVHTGESTVISPCQTLDNKEFQDMRTLSIEVAKSIDLVGECNVQFALNPSSYDFFIIETNPRMSRSSALASKATGYPLAYVSAKLSLGYSIYEILNKVSGKTTAFFEPSLDYLVMKIPRWDMSKFEHVDSSLATEMKSIGEVMSIGRTFEETFQKAVRMLDIGEPGLVGGKIYFSSITKDEALNYMRQKRPYWFLYAMKAFKEGATIDEVYDSYGVDKFFLMKLKALVDIYEKFRKEPNLNAELIQYLKTLGFSDEQLQDEAKIRDREGIYPRIKRIDTLAGEWDAVTNYLYTTYKGVEDDVKPSDGRKLLVVGAGGFRIGVSVEFDWSVVSVLNEARKYFDDVAVLNYNPETVSTDWDIAGKLFFDEISVEKVKDIVKKEGFTDVCLFSGGQLGNSIAKKLEEEGIRIYGSSGSAVDSAEDREKFSSLLDKLGIPQPKWISARDISQLRRFIDEVGFPVLVRPSYVLSGSSMAVAYNNVELNSILSRASKISEKYPVVISKYLTDAVEAEIDGATDGKKVIGAVLEHVEEAGVHSGDATISIPNRKLTHDLVLRMKKYAVSIVNELGVKGPFNLQMVIKDNTPYVIEMNMRASRSMPFTSKAKGFNIIGKAVEAIEKGLDQDEEFYEPPSSSWAVKSPEFSWAQLRGAYPFLGPEMRSTGEVASFGVDFYDALIKSWLSSPPNAIPDKGKKALVYGERNVEYLEETARNLSQYGLDIITLDGLNIKEGEVVALKPAEELLLKKEIGIVVTEGFLESKDYNVRRLAADLNIPLILNARLASEVSKAFNKEDITFFEISEYGGGI